MRFEIFDKVRIPPVPGRTIRKFETAYDYEEPHWRAGRDPIKKRIVQLVVVVDDDGTTKYRTYAKRVKKDGDVYNEDATRVYGWERNSPADAAHDAVVEAFRKTDEWARL